MHDANYRPALLAPAEGLLPQRATAAACLRRAGKLLLELRPPDAKVTPGVYDLPGGHLQPGESPEQALVREMDEELGITLLRFRLGLVQDEHGGSVPGFYRHYLYLVESYRGTVVAREGAELVWVDLDRLPELRPLNPLIGFALAQFARWGWLGD